MNEFEAAGKSGKVAEFHEQLLELAKGQNRSSGGGTSIPATFMIALFVLVLSARAAAPPAAAKPAPLPLQVKLDVSPPPTSLADFVFASFLDAVTPFWSSPKVGDMQNQQITLTATLPQSVMAAVPHPLYTFIAVLSPGGETFVIKQLTKSNQVTWTPTKGGDYKFRVVVKRGFALGSDTVDKYHVRPRLTSTVRIFASPPQAALPGEFTISAIAMGPPAPLASPGAAAGPLMRTRSESWFYYQARFSTTPAHGWEGPIISIGSKPAHWRPSPLPNLYVIYAYVRTFRNNVLTAEGFVRSDDSHPESFYRDFYAVKYPPGQCPTPTIPADPTQPFSWSNPITKENASGQPVEAPLAAGGCAIAGHNLDDIANNEKLRVRSNNISCRNCHQDLFKEEAGRAWLCMYFVSQFPHNQDPDQPHEDMLFQLFSDWWNRGCPVN